MSLQLKPSLIIIGTLLLGMLLGAVGSSTIMRYRFERMEDFRRPRSFSNRIFESIGPLDGETENSLRVILESNGQRIRSEMDQGKQCIRAIIDSTLMQMEPLLTDEQYNRAKDIMGRGPGPHGSKGHKGFRHRPGMKRN